MESEKRPDFLTLLCVLSFIGSGCALLSYLSVGLSFNTLRHLVFETDTYKAYLDMRHMRVYMAFMFSLPQWYFLLNGLLYAASFAGVVLMWRLRRTGFHVYTIAQCLIILLGMLIVPGTDVPYGAIVWTGLFVAGYAVNLKHMNKY